MYILCRLQLMRNVVSTVLNIKYLTVTIYLYYYKCTSYTVSEMQNYLHKSVPQTTV